MQMAPREDLERAYENLTPKQKAIVDARVQHPDVPKTHISRDYAPKIYNEQYAESEDQQTDEFNNSYVTQALNGKSNEIIPEIIKYKQEIKENQRTQGTEKTTGDPFSASPNLQEDDSTWQTWDDRPNKQAAQRQSKSTQSQEHTQQDVDAEIPIQIKAPVAARIEDDAVHVVLDKDYFKGLLESQALPAELHKQLMSDVLSEQLG